MSLTENINDKESYYLPHGNIVKKSFGKRVVDVKVDAKCMECWVVLDDGTYIRIDCTRDRTVSYLTPLYSENEHTPNDPKLSERGAGRGCCGKVAGVAAVVGAAAVTCVAVRCSAWLGDGSFDFVLFCRLIQAALCIFGIVIAVSALRVSRDNQKYLKQREKEYRNR